RPGVLYEILGSFALRKINLTNLVLRPSIQKLGNYNIFIEFEGHQKDKNVSDALADLEKTADFKVLGSFAMDS
ncbi:ACT domain-containing protein, partial [Candidatus Woesearchaeota archaeon]|nr:ACT domain-containing protein [Candidatus Woesearchaeota archaeon]